MAFVQVALPVREGIAAWAAAASTAGALLPGRVHDMLQSLPWEDHGSQYPEDPDDLLDAFSVLEAVAAACRSLYREDPSWYPMPRGMECGINPDGGTALIWRSDTHLIELRLGGGWSTADLEGRNPHWSPDMTSAVLAIEGETLNDSPRVAAAEAASSTLQARGWY